MSQMTEKNEKEWRGESEEPEGGASRRPVWDSRKSTEWNQEEENPFCHKAGIRRFRELYTGKRRRDRTAWADYFVSGDFLEGYREGRFAKLLLETVREHQKSFPLCKEFLTELSIAYGLQTVKTEDGLQLRIENSAFFYGMDYICEIMQMGAAAIRFKGNDFAMLAGFRDYRELLMLAVSDWDDDTMLKLGSLIDHYGLSDLSDRPIPNAQQYELSQRHPKSLKLITYFFASQELPERVYQIPWNHLRLENATLGKEKLFYGSLRETVLARAPKLGEKPRTSYKELLREFYSAGCFCNEGRTLEGRKAMEAYFEREDLSEALRDPAFVEEQVLHYWITKGSSIYFLGKLREYFEEHAEAPFADRALRQIDGMVDYCQIGVKLQEDEQSDPVRGSFNLRNRAYLRYYLNTAFPLARGIRCEVMLQEYLEERMPYSAKWGKKLSDPGKGGFSSETPLRILFGEDELQIVFFPRHIEYRWNKSRMVPFYPAQKLAGIEDDTMFWLLAPIALASRDCSREICTELTRRLARLPVSGEDIPVIADCMTGFICRLDACAVPVCSFYAEKEEQMFGCEIYEDFMVKIYEVTAEGKQELENGRHPAADLETALQTGERFLQDVVMDRTADTGMEVLPEQVLVKNQYHVSQTLTGSEVTEKEIYRILSRFFEGMLDRVELAWSGGSLLFIKSGQNYACFYFRHWTQDWFALVSMPEVYQVVESEDVVYEPFALGMLPNYLIHPNPDRIMRQLDDIMAQIARKNPAPRNMMWAPQIYRFEMRQRYRLAKRQFGGYPEEKAQNQIMDRFYIPKLPVYLSWTGLDGKESGKKAVLKNKARLQQILADYMAGRLLQLVLIWHCETGGDYTNPIQKRYIVLMQDQGSHVMIWLESDRGGMEYLVSDVNEYLDADEKRYRKTVFRGRTIPGYRVHTDMRRIRDGLDLLIPQLPFPIVNKGGFGEFSYENEKEYEWVKAELQRMEAETDTPL